MPVRLAASALAVLPVLVPAAAARAAVLNLTVSGTVASVVDASEYGLPAVAFPPAPVGSAFGATITYSGNAAMTDGGTGFARFLDLTPSSATLTVNGATFTAASGA